MSTHLYGKMYLSHHLHAQFLTILSSILHSMYFQIGKWYTCQAMKMCPIQILHLYIFLVMCMHLYSVNMCLGVSSWYAYTV